MLPRCLRLLAPLYFSAILLGCATPAENFIGTATQLGFSIQDLDGNPYQHKLFANPEAQYADNINTLHIYLDGDGTPWERNTRIAEDPTPRNPVILKLMVKDQGPALLLGRPCYYGLNRSDLCNNRLWTSHRYASEVVNSMLAALKHWISPRKVKHLVLIGYSGGGALATLLAPLLDKTSTVVTIAGNLDIIAWSERHGYISLSGSLNPMTDAHIPPDIKQFHLAGLEDFNVPADIIESFSATQKNALFLPQPGYTHSCCWIEIWPDILKTYLKQ